MSILPLSFRFNENAATIRFKRSYLSGILFLLGSGWAGLCAPRCKLSIQEFPLSPFRPSKAEVLAGSLRFSCEFPQPLTRVSGPTPGLASIPGFRDTHSRAAGVQGADLRESRRSGGRTHQSSRLPSPPSRAVVPFPAPRLTAQPNRTVTCGVEACRSHPTQGNTHLGRLNEHLLLLVNPAHADPPIPHLAET